MDKLFSASTPAKISSKACNGDISSDLGLYFLISPSFFSTNITFSTFSSFNICAIVGIVIYSVTLPPLTFLINLNFLPFSIL